VPHNSLIPQAIETPQSNEATAKSWRYNSRMAKMVEIHPKNPQPRLIAEVVAEIRSGALIAYPTDSSYALGCHLGNKNAMDRIHQIRKTDKKHNFTLVCKDLSEISLYARVESAMSILIGSGF
jgi:tRNA A37 threonylcarbamoyladenosine synthetase subunit TsaC/SUA5/YrdC